MSRRLSVALVLLLGCGDGGGSTSSAGGGDGTSGPTTGATTAGAGGSGGATPRCEPSTFLDEGACADEGPLRYGYWCEVGSPENAPGEPPFPGCKEVAGTGTVGTDWQVGWCCAEGAGGAGGSSSQGGGGSGGAGGASSSSSTASSSNSGAGGGAPCGANETECNGNCVSNDDPAYGCGSCTPCGLAPNSLIGCDAGVCTYSCPPNQDDCDGFGFNGCEIFLNSDDANCGACGNDCSVIEGPGSTCDGMGVCTPVP